MTRGSIASAQPVKASRQLAITEEQPRARNSPSIPCTPPARHPPLLLPSLHPPSQHLVKTLGRAHAGLDGQAAHVLPPLLEQRHEVVDAQHDVADELLLVHVDVADRHAHAQHLLQLELDRRLDLRDLGAEVLVVRDGRRELAGWR